MMESFFKIKTFKSLKKVTESFSNGKNFKGPKKVMEFFFGIKNVKATMLPFFSIKNFESSKAVMEFFLSFKSFKNRKKMTESFCSGHASLGFHMMHKFPGTALDYIGTTFEQHFFDYHSILISMKKDVEHISVNTERAHK